MKQPLSGGLEYCKMVDILEGYPCCIKVNYYGAVVLLVHYNKDVLLLIDYNGYLLELYVKALSTSAIRRGMYLGSVSWGYAPMICPIKYIII